MNQKKFDRGITWLILLIILYWLLAVIFAPKAESKEARTIRINEKQVATIRAQMGRTTVLSFTARPTKVIVGSNGSFFVEYVDNDIAIGPMYAGAKSNLFVYVGGNRFAFDLVTGGIADQVVMVRDPLEKEIKVKSK